jgi:hypothetical protein
MRHFQDSVGRNWFIEITRAAVDRCATLAGVDIATPAGWYALGAVPGRLPAVLFAIVQPTAASLGINQEEFEAAIDAKAIEAGSSALIEALFDAMPAKDRAAMRKDFAKAMNESKV